MKLIPRVLGSLSILLASGLVLPSAMAATINVSELTDSFGGATCTLRNAIESMNTGGDFGGCSNSTSDAYGTNDTVNLVAGTYVLSLDGGGEDNNQNGDLDISASMSLIGAGADQTSISGSGFSSGESDRVLNVIQRVAPSGDGSILVAIEALTIRDGNLFDGEGGGLAVNYPGSEVNVSNVIVTENQNSGGDGGGIENDAGLLTLTNCQITDNFASSDGGGIETSGQSNNAAGLETVGTTIVVNSTIDGNEAPDDGGGIQIEDGAMLIVNSTISNNSCLEEDSDTIVISGGLFGDGGGIAAYGGSLVLINSTVSNNEAGFQGGGIIANGQAVGGLSSLFVLLLNTTVAENTVLDTAGFGGGLCFNCSEQANGLGGGEFEISNSLVAGNEAVNGPDCAGDFGSGGFNLVQDATDCLGFTQDGDQSGVDPLIGPLQNNGGPTETHALLEGSPAIDQADSEGCVGLDVAAFASSQGGTFTTIPLTDDQRGFLRPVAVLDPAVAICDIGAYEFQVAQPTPSPTPTATPVPPFTGLVEGSGIGCSLNPAAAASSAGTLWMALSLAIGFRSLRRRSSK